LEVQGDGFLGSVQFTVAMADLMGQPEPSIVTRFMDLRPGDRARLPLDRSGIDFQT